MFKDNIYLQVLDVWEQIIYTNLKIYHSVLLVKKDVKDVVIHNYAMNVKTDTDLIQPHLLVLDVQYLKISYLGKL